MYLIDFKSLTFIYTCIYIDLIIKQFKYIVIKRSWHKKLYYQVSCILMWLKQTTSQWSLNGPKYRLRTIFHAFFQIFSKNPVYRVEEVQQLSAMEVVSELTDQICLPTSLHPADFVKYEAMFLFTRKTYLQTRYLDILIFHLHWSVATF